VIKPARKTANHPSKKSASTRESTRKLPPTQSARKKTAKTEPLSLELIYTDGAFNGCW
jgi:hypothetical protein